MADRQADWDAIDMDGHIIEPGDLYLRRVDARYRDKAVRVVRGKDHLNHYFVRGRPHGLFPVMAPAEPGMWERLGRVTVSDRGAAWMREFERGWDETAAPGASEPYGRLEVMDQLGIGASLLFPTVGLSFEEDVLDDPDYTYAHLRAYNDWILEYCSVDPRRLLAVTHVSLLDLDAAVAEIERTAAAGTRGILMRCVAVGPHPPSHRHFDRVWAAIQDHDLLLALHIFSPPRTVVNWGRQGRQSLFRKCLETLPQILGISDLILGGVLHRYPKLRVASVENNSAWVQWILGTMDEKAKSPQTSECPDDLLPSERFHRQCWVTPDPRENFHRVARHIGIDRALFSTDYPHSESDPKVVDNWRRVIASYPGEQQAWFLRENALACLGDPDGEATGPRTTPRPLRPGAGDDGDLHADLRD